jgi:hypothetical protein
MGGGAAWHSNLALQFMGDQYQKELYRCLFPILDGYLIMSLEFVIKSDLFFAVFRPG